jgi:fumarate hydratase subunit alpha
LEFYSESSSLYSFAQLTSYSRVLKSISKDEFSKLDYELDIGEISLDLSKIIEETALDLLRLAVIELPADVKQALKRAAKLETSEIGKMEMEAITNNLKLAEQLKRPICQDTGLIIFYLDVGDEFGSIARIPEALIRATKRGTTSIPLRPNVVHPITRKNTGNNTGVGIPCIYWNPIEGDYLQITAFPKGAGSENMSVLSMIKPGEGLVGIKKFVLDTVIRAGGQPCPPLIVGVGIGGTCDLALKLAKQALLRPLNKHHFEPMFARLEKDLLEAINSTGIGPMGLGGRTTALGVNIEYAHCHTASLPVGVNLQCWAARRATARIFQDGRVEFLSHKKPS